MSNLVDLGFPPLVRLVLLGMLSFMFANLIVLPYVLWRNRHMAMAAIAKIALWPWRGLMLAIRYVVNVLTTPTEGYCLPVRFYVVVLSLLAVLLAMVLACGAEAKTVRPMGPQCNYPNTNGIHLAVDIGTTRDVWHWTVKSAVPKMRVRIRKGGR